MRIDKFISESGIASRKECAKAAKAGLLLVDGVLVKDTSKHIDPEAVSVSFMGRVIEYKRFVYVLLNKPEGYVSATEDGKFPVVTELLPEELQKRGLFPVGRLDKDTVGVMLLTDDGKLAHTVLSPKRHVSKVYYFECAEPLDADAEEIFKSGVTLYGYGIIIGNEHVYVGQFIDGMQQNLGIHKDDRENIYIGQFENAEYSGEGIFYYNDGRYHKGHFKDSEQYGKGEYFNKNCELIVGDFADPEYVKVDFIIDKEGNIK